MAALPRWFVATEQKLRALWNLERSAPGQPEADAYIRRVFVDRAVRLAKGAAADAWRRELLAAGCFGLLQAAKLRPAYAAALRQIAVGRSCSDCDLQLELLEQMARGLPPGPERTDVARVLQCYRAVWARWRPAQCAGDELVDRRMQAWGARLPAGGVLASVRHPKPENPVYWLPRELALCLDRLVAALSASGASADQPERWRAAWRQEVERCCAQAFPRWWRLAAAHNRALLDAQLRLALPALAVRREIGQLPPCGRAATLEDAAAVVKAQRAAWERFPGRGSCGTAWLLVRPYYDRLAIDLQAWATQLRFVGSQKAEQTFAGRLRRGGGLGGLNGTCLAHKDRAELARAVGRSYAAEHGLPVVEQGTEQAKSAFRRWGIPNTLAVGPFAPGGRCGPFSFLTPALYVDDEDEGTPQAVSIPRPWQEPRPGSAAAGRARRRGATHNGRSRTGRRRP